MSPTSPATTETPSWRGFEPGDIGTRMSPETSPMSPTRRRSR